ncbi:hypothetical protein [Streptomyces sp. NPDC051569]|uniref:hypothetical protein n=1 Tax=Streptomyces sp. NPDC051569 TaxID=3365661 RepID=UPI00378F0D10
MIPFVFTAADRSTDPADLAAYRAHWQALTGPDTDFGWLDSAPAVSYHDMAHAVCRSLGSAALSEVDLVITVAAGPDCRHESLPGAVLAARTGNDPLAVGVSEQGAAGPFTALRIAAAQLATGACRRALVLLLEQSTLAPGPAVVRPGRDAAVALLLGSGTGPALGRAGITVTGPRAGGTAAPRWAGSATARAAEPEPVHTVLAGPGLGDLEAAPGVRLVRAEPGLPVTGLWMALARLLATGDLPAGQVLVTDRDPVLPYVCDVSLTIAAADSTDRGGNGRRRHAELVR